MICVKRKTLRCTRILEKNIQNDSEIDALYYIWIRVRIEETVYQIKQGVGLGSGVVNN